MQYLEGLNEQQKEAVLATDGPVSVLAGAGSGKTRVLTTRIYHLIRQGVAPESILAVTFTNKAAREMKERLAVRLGNEGSLPFVATFHGLGREILQQYGSPLGIPRFFTIFDRDDSERVIKEGLKALDVDPKEIAPRFVMSRISKSKSDGVSQQTFSEKSSRDSFRNRIVADVWKRYEEALKREKALDFDDLIVLPVKLLETYPEVRAMVQHRFSHVHVDEYQDTNALQARFVDLLLTPAQNVFVVGDIDQCLGADTQVRMADGSLKQIQFIKENDIVLSNYGSGKLAGAKVEKVIQKKTSGNLVRIHTESGRIIDSTPEHIHFAGYKLGLTPQLYFVYLMKKNGVGWRIGMSQTYTNGQRKIMVGFQQRCNHEHGDSLWILGTYESSQEARVNEYKLSLSYGIPTLPFMARKSKNIGGYVHDQEVIDEIFNSFNTESAARQLLSDKDFSMDYPHHRAQGTLGRRNIVIALCGEHRGDKAMHRISMVGRDAEGKRALQEAGFSVRPAKAGSVSWRFETAFADFSKLHEAATKLLAIFPNAQLVQTARLGGNKEKPKDGNSLPFLPAGSVLQGMALFNEENGYEIVKKVGRIESAEKFVYDLNVQGTHNFFANGICTHNCVYTWRNATIENLLEFEKTYPSAKTIILEHNYRSTKNIVDAANQIIELNRNRKEKRSVTDNPSGEKIIIHPEDSAEREGRYVAREARARIRAGTAPEEIAVLFRTNFQSRVLEEAFLAEGVPYKLLGTRFFDRKEVKDVLSWVRLALEPTRESDRARAVQTPPRGIGKVTLGKIIAGMHEEFKPAERTKVAAFEAVIHSLSQASETELPSVFVRMVIEKSGIQSHLEKGSEDDQERLENVKELVTLASRYDSLPGKEGISLFLTDAALASDQDELDRKQNSNGVTLMTVHAAKGLEFDTVFVTGLEEGLFPHEARESDEKHDEEEERRLFYVAVTRAKKHLYLTFARIRRIYGTDFISEPSQFLRDIDPSLTDYQESENEYEDIIEL